MTRSADEGLWVGPDADPDRYALGPVVGGGSEGILYRGSRTTAGINLDVAIKMLQPCFLSRVDEWSARWSEQVELLRSLQAPGVVGVRDGFQGPVPHRVEEAKRERTLYLVMNWVEGKPLQEWVRGDLDPNPLEVLKVLLGAAAALDLMHSGQLTAGIPVLHCDVKPANLLVTPRSGTVLVDFGLMRSMPDGPRLSIVTGTPGYAAPEVVKEGKYTQAADRYSLGAVGYFLLTGMDPPEAHDPTALRAGLAAVPALARQPEVVDHVMAMLDGAPEQRPTALANWVGQVRRSSLVELPSNLAPEALKRNPNQAPGIPMLPGPAGRIFGVGGSGTGGPEQGRADVAERAGEVSIALSTLARSLYDVEDDERLAFVYSRADAPGRIGESARAIIALLSPIWVQYLVAKEVVDQLDVAIAAGRSAEAERLLGPDVIALAGGASTSVHLHLQALERQLGEVVEGAERLRRGFREGESRLDSFTVAVSDLLERATQLGVVDDEEVDSAVQRLREAETAFGSDPLVAGLTDEVDLAVARAREHLEELEGVHHHLPERLGVAASIVDEIAGLVAEGAEVLAATEEKIARPQGLLELIDPFIVDGNERSLRPWLNRIAQQAETGDWRAAALGLESWRRVADPLLAGARLIDQANRAPLVRRNDLRGLLHSYRAKALADRRAEDLTLKRLHEQACDELYSAPCGLESAETKVQAYIDAVNTTPKEDAQ